MSIAFTCPCGKPLRAAAEYAGRGVKCPACGKALTIPARSGDPVRAAAAPAASRPAAPEPADGYIHFNCPCGKAMQAKAEYAGRLARCPACGDNVFIPKDDADARFRPGKPSSLASQTPLPPKKAPPPADDFDEEPDFEEVDEVDEGGDLEEVPEERPPGRKGPTARAGEDDDRPRPKKKPAKKKERRGGGGLWLVLAFAAVVLLLLAGGVGALAWWLRSEGAPLGDDHLALVPGDAHLFVTARMAEVLSQPALKQKFDQMTPAQKVMAANMEWDFGVDPADMERVTLVFIDPKGDSGWLMVTSAKPYDRQRILKGLGSDAKRVRYEGRAYHVAPGGKAAVCFSGPNTFVAGPEAGVKRCLEVANGKKGTGLIDPAVARAAEHLVVVSAVPGPEQVQQFRAGMLNANPMARDLQPLTEFQSFTATADLTGTKTTVEVTLSFADETGAQKAGNALAWALRSLSEKMTVAAHADGMQPKAAQLAMTSLSSVLDQLQPVRNGKELKLNAQFDLSILDGLSTLAAPGDGPPGINPPPRSGRSGRGRSG